MIMCDAAEVRAIRVSYAGELGFELYMPNYQLPSIYQSLFRVGKEIGLRDLVILLLTVCEWRRCTVHGAMNLLERSLVLRLV